MLAVQLFADCFELAINSRDGLHGARVWVHSTLEFLTYLLNHLLAYILQGLSERVALGFDVVRLFGLLFLALHPFQSHELRLEFLLHFR